MRRYVITQDQLQQLANIIARARVESYADVLACEAAKATVQHIVKAQAIVQPADSEAPDVFENAKTG